MFTRHKEILPDTVRRSDIFTITEIDKSINKSTESLETNVLHRAY